MASTTELYRYMENMGVTYNGDFLLDGQIHRFKPEGKKNPDGWYVIFDNGGYLTACFGDWSSDDICYKWSSVSQKLMTPEQRHILKTKVQESQKKAQEIREQAQAAAKAEAIKIWNSALEVSQHPYLVKKGIDAPLGIKQYLHPHYGSSLIIPLYDDTGLSSLQFIYWNEEAQRFEKRFLPDGGISGCRMVIGDPTERILLAEGYATAWSLHKATGDMVMVVFNCHNLPKVAASMSASDNSFLICADNDSTQAKNAGLKAAIKAANMTAFPCAYPILTDGTDFNDLYLSHGLDEVKRQLFVNVLKPRPKEVAEHLATLDGYDLIDLKKKFAKRLDISQVDLYRLVQKAKKSDAQERKLPVYAASVRNSI